jgi:Type I phosphodiesterase / nucleotide pyrophosphatase
MLNSLAGLSQSIFASLGLANTTNHRGLPESKRTVLILIDGLGYNSLAEFSDQFPIFKELVSSDPLSSHFPTTTATNLVSLGTGELPGVHGMLGYTVRVPRSGTPGRLLNALKWDERVDPLSWQPIPTLYERASKAGIEISHIAEKRYEGSGFTQAGMRGARYIGANHNSEIIQAAKAAHQSEKSYSYVYLNVVDSAGHAHGVGSDRWLSALQTVAELLEALMSALPAETDIYLTADHGMINVEEKIILGEGNNLLENVTLIGGEARARHIYLKEGSVPETAIQWSEYFGERVEIFTKEDAQQLFGGSVSDNSLDRMGDLIAVPREGIVLLDPAIASKESLMVGHHGGFTQNEVLIPLLSYRT